MVLHGLNATRVTPKDTPLDLCKWSAKRVAFDGTLAGREYLPSDNLNKRKIWNYLAVSFTTILSGEKDNVCHWEQRDASGTHLANGDGLSNSFHSTLSAGSLNA